MVTPQRSLDRSTLSDFNSQRKVFGKSVIGVPTGGVGLRNNHGVGFTQNSNEGRSSIASSSGTKNRQLFTPKSDVKERKFT